MTIPEKNRITGLDQLRGICASSIMVMHYFSFLHYEHDATTYLGRMGFYGVSIFYILSGLTLYLVYKNKMNEDLKSIKSFLIRRFFRIYPLLWLVIIYNAVWSIFISHRFIETEKVLLNLTGLFGFFSWSNYIGVGTWSIGNELVFYTLFPILMFALRKSKSLYFLLYFASFAVFLYFTFFKLTDIHAPDFWDNYVNPLNQFFYFASGVTLGMVAKLKISKNALSFIFGASVLFFLFWPVSGDEYYVAIGLNRLLFTISSILISLFFLYRNISYPPFLQRFFSFLGEISYSIYLLHPLVIFAITLVWYKCFDNNLQNNLILVSVSLISTIITSYVSYRYFEKYFMNIGKKY